MVDLQRYTPDAHTRTYSEMQSLGICGVRNPNCKITPMEKGIVYCAEYLPA